LRLAVHSAVVLTALVAVGGPLRAQCPDGTPPPCRARAAGPAARANPPLDERTWIVLPFQNLSRAQDIEWLRDASVNLLYLDLSRWQDIRVIDDERVADLMREVAAARGGAELTLQTGLAVARRAGAGKLVMGDLLKVGSRTQVIAKVFDVRTGQRMRTVREETAFADSLMGIFGRLARGILDVAPPAGVTLGAVGTSRVDAYQAYAAGVTALNAWRLTEARQHFTRAIALDSTFALAHYKQALVLGWDAPTDRSRRTHAETAARLATSLPARERALVAGLLAQARNQWGEACETYQRLIRADSGDVEAWYNYGECQFHDPIALIVGGDSSRMQFRGSYNASIGAFQRALELDPSNHLAFQHIQDALVGLGRGGCLPNPTSGECQIAVQGALTREADSLVTIPVQLDDGGVALRRQLDAAARAGAREANLREAQRFARLWLAAAPTEPRALIANGRLWLRLGRSDSAEFYLARATPDGSFERSRSASDRVELHLKRERFADARRLLDSLYGAPGQGAWSNEVIFVRAGVEAAFGRFAAVDTLVSRNIRGAPPHVTQYFRLMPRVAAGMPIPDTMVALERQLAANPPGSRTQIFAGIAPALVWTARQRRTDQWPLTDSASSDPALRLAAAYASGDTARLRAATTAFDEALPGLTAQGTSPAALILSAEAHLALADTNLASQRMARFEELWASAPLTELTQFPVYSGSHWARAFLLSADLAAARGQRDIAIRGYRRVVGLWEGADPEFQPAVARARQALVTLGAN